MNGRYLKVQLTDPLYEGETEWIDENQVRSSESKTESKTD
jgi:hypothetical protein